MTSSAKAAGACCGVGERTTCAVGVGQDVAVC